MKCESMFCNSFYYIFYSTYLKSEINHCMYKILFLIKFQLLFTINALKIIHLSRIDFT